MANPNPSPATRFQKGRASNPHGRPQTKPLTDELRKQLTAQARGATASELVEIVRGVIRQAKAGDMAAIRLCWEYLEGKPVQPQEVSGPAGTAIEFTLSILKADNGNSDRAG